MSWGCPSEGTPTAWSHDMPETPESLENLLRLHTDLVL